MQPIEWFKEQDTVVQVGVVLLGIVGIGVALTILLVALVIGAAVLGTFVLGIGDGGQAATPSATFDFEQTSDGVQITHAGGDSIPASRLIVAVEDTRRRWGSYTTDDGQVEAGDAIVVSATSGDRIRIIYDGEEGRTVLEQYTVG